MGWVPIEFGSSRQQLLAEFKIAAAVSQIPLAGRDDLQWFVALLEEFDGVSDWLRFTNEVARFGQQSDRALLGGEDRRAGDCRIGLAGGFVGDPGRGFTDDPAVPSEDRPGGQVQLAPPDDVREVTEGTDHRDAGSLFRICQRVGHNGDVDLEHRRRDGSAEQRLVALVVRVGNECDTRRQQFRSGGFDVDRFAAIRTCEPDAVVGPGTLAVLKLCLSHGGSERDVPQGGCLGLVGLVTCEVAQERLLRSGPRVAVDRLVRV